MPLSRQFAGIAVLIPGYNVEDIPTDLSEERACGLLNAVVCAWHPAAIAVADGIPQFRYADVSELSDAAQILFVPACSHEWMGHDWEQLLESGNCQVILGTTDRNDWQTRVETLIPDDQTLPPQELVNDFLALGLAHYIVTVLSRRMHHYIDPDSSRLTQAVQAAANSAFGGDTAAARTSLQECFECLLETREQIYPVDCFLADFCLSGSSDDTSNLSATIASADKLNLQISPSSVKNLEEASPECANQLKDAVTAGRCCLVGGGFHELRTTTGTLASAYNDLRRASEVAMPLRSRIWGQRRFGLYHSLPALLQLFEYDFALHVALDDGLYPEQENGCFSWSGPDGSTTSATSRLPLAIDSSASFLRFPERLAESMQQDQSSLLLLAHLPQLATPWLDDLRRIQRYAAIPGRFITLEEFAGQAGDAGEPVSFPAGEYLSSWLIQSAVLKTEAPVSGAARLYQARQELQRFAFLNAMIHMIAPEANGSEQITEFERRLANVEAERLSSSEPADLTSQEEVLNQICSRVTEQTSAMVHRLARLLPRGESDALLVVNALPFARSGVVLWPHAMPGPAASESIDAVRDQNGQHHVAVRLPPGGFIRLSAVSACEPQAFVTSTPGRPLAQPGLLRNEHFEVLMSESTGGIADVRFHGQRANRVSQQVGLRYESPRTIPATEETPERETAYALTRCDGQTVIESGPVFGAVESRCAIVDAISGEELWRFRQTTCVDRASPRIQINIAADSDCIPVTGNPWMTYVACRFAWENEAASVYRGLLGQVCGIHGERFESSDFVEIVDGAQRLLILPHGRPYHRRSGRRMLDSLLIVEGETADRFAVTLAFDEPYPMRTALDVQQPLLTERVSKSTSSCAWILGLTAKNVQIAWTRCEDQKLILLLEETDGRAAACHMRTAQKVAEARERRATGTSVSSLEVTPTGIALKFRAFEIKEVELTF